VRARAPTGVIFALNGSNGSGSATAAAARSSTPSPRGAGPTGPAAASDGLRPPSYIGERFFLGGCDSVRGFAYRGLGPSAERARRRDGAGAADDAAGAAAGHPTRDALGGDLFGSLYAGVVARLPGQLGEIGGCMHAFVNGGSASLLSHPPAAAAAAGGGRGGAFELVPEGGAGDGGAAGAAASLGGAVRRRAAELAATCRWSAGVGLVLPTPFGRFEANYVWLLSGQPGDVARPGMQFGFAASPISPAGPV
jgi:outer membrane protein insertion porin family